MDKVLFLFCFLFVCALPTPPSPLLILFPWTEMIPALRREETSLCIDWSSMFGTSRDRKTIGVGWWLSLYSGPRSGWKLPEDSWGGPCILFFLLKILWFFISTSVKKESSSYILLIWKLEERNSCDLHPQVGLFQLHSGSTRNGEGAAS